MVRISREKNCGQYGLSYWFSVLQPSHFAIQVVMKSAGSMAFIGRYELQTRGESHSPKQELNDTGHSTRQINQFLQMLVEFTYIFFVHYVLSRNFSK